MSEKELDLRPIKKRLENEDYLPQPEWAEQDIVALIAEVERLRGEVWSLKREVNEYEGKDWRSYGPVYPEVVDEK